MKKVKYLLLWIVSLLWIGYSFSYNTAFLSYTNSSWTNHYYTNMISSAIHWGFINSNWVKFSPYGQTFWCQVNVNQSMYFENYYADKAIFFPEQYCSYTKIWNPTINNSSAVSRYYINNWDDSLLFNYLHVFYLTDRNYYDDYFFLTSSYLYNMSWEYLDIPWWLSRVKVIPWLYKSYSSISVSNWQSEDYSEDYFQFSFVPEDWFQDWGFYNITWILVLHNDSYSNWFLTWTNTIILFKDNSNIYYNLFDEYSNSLIELLSLTPSSKWILYSNWSNWFSSFSDFVFDSWSLIQSSFGNWYLTFNSVNKNLEYWNMSFSVQFSLQSDDSVIYWYDFVNWWGWNESIWNNVSPVSSLYYQCLGPSYNTPDWLPPSFCFDSSWNLNLDRLLNCYNDLLVVDWELQNETFCNINWFVENIEFVPDWSWYSIVPCSSWNCSSPFVFGPDYLNFDPVFELSTWTIENMFTNITGRVWKCPFPYTDFQLWKDSWFLKYLKSLGFKYDPFVFANCVIAWFHQWRNTITDMAWLTFLDQPLINWDTEQHRILFVFLDFVVILWFFWLTAFLKRIF